MEKLSNVNNEVQSKSRSVGRRTFLKYAGATAGMATLIIAGCSDDDDDSKPETVDLGSGDTGILNYAYALEQLEAGFYTSVTSNAAFTSIFNEEEQMILADIRDHEIAHRDFFKAALGDNAIGALEPDFSDIDFGNRDSILSAAKTFEDLGVAAYNGAGNLLTDVNLLLVAGKIVSVEARHAAAIRDLINPMSADFAGDDVVDANGLDAALMPSEVLTAADPYITTPVTGNNLPTS